MKRISFSASRVLAAFSALCLFGTAPTFAQAAPQNLATKSESKTPVRVAQTSERLAKLEALMVEMVNAARAEAGLVPLGIDEDLADTARAHSLEMRDKKYFAHESPTESLKTPLDRYRASIGDTPRTVAENIFHSWGGSPRTVQPSDVRTAHDALMKSPGHRKNILTPNLTRIGIGFIVNPNGDLWITQMFSRP